MICLPLLARRVIAAATARGLTSFAWGVVEMECHDSSPKVWLGVMKECARPSPAGHNRFDAEIVGGG